MQHSTRPHRAVQCTLQRLIERAGATQTWSAMSLSSTTGCKRTTKRHPRCVVRHLGRGLLVPGCPAAALDGCQRAMPACRMLKRKCVKKPGVAAVAGEAEKTKRYGTAVRPLVFLTYGRLGGEGTKLLRDLVTTAAAKGQCSPHAVGRWRTQLERVLLTAQADTYLRAPGSGVAERLAAEPPAVDRLHSFCLFGGVCRATLM